MLCFDTNLLADYLDGVDAAATFLEAHDDELWAVPSLALFEAYMGALYGRPRGNIDDVFEATRGLEVLDVTDETVLRAARLQRDLKDDGLELGFVDAILVATADEAGAAFATNDGTVRHDAVKEKVDIVDYER